MEYVDWIVKVCFLGVTVWAVKMYLNERALRSEEERKRHAPGEQSVIWAELNQWCEKRKHEIVKNLEKEMGHVVELIRKDLERGQENFDRLEKAQGMLIDALNRLNITTN